MVSPKCLPQAIILAALTTVTWGQQPSAPPIREIYVPFEDLNVILDNDKHRVFLTRDEYEELIKSAKARPQIPAPHKVLLVSANYDGRLEEGRALITGELMIDVLEEGLFVLPLELGGVGVRSASLDGRAAPLARREDANVKLPGGGALLLLRGKGLHKLELQLTAPVATAAAQQTLQFQLPANAATRLKLSVPGNIEIKAGAAVISRNYDEPANRTSLELIPQRGTMAIVMSLNNRLLKDERVIVARSVIVDEVTQGYERIHATISYRLLHGTVEKLRIAIPAGFEVTTVDSVLLARWEEKKDPAGARTLEASLREPTSEQVVLHLTANHSPAASANWLAELQNWSFPKLEPLDTAGQVAVVGLVVEDRLRPEKIAATGLLPIDSAAMASALPASVRKAEPGAPVVRQVTSYYAPAGDYSLSASLVRPPTELKVATNSLLIAGDQGLTLQGGFAVTPRAESLFVLHFSVPAGWQVTQVTLADGAALPIERYPLPSSTTRIAVQLPQGIHVGQSQTINYQAVKTPTGWLAEWTSQNVEFPQILVEEVTSVGGAIAVQTVDDLVVRPVTLTGLTPLVDNEKAAFALGNIPTALAYRFESRDYSASLIVERTSPSIAARVYSFLKLQRDNLSAHCELVYDVREARTRRLTFSLPSSTPTELSVRGLAGTNVKEFTSTVDGERRRWVVQLAERQIGDVRLAIDFTQRLPQASATNVSLPLVQAEDVEYQSALVAVEGDAELDVNVATDARAVDIGELSRAGYTLGRRVIGTYGYVGTQASVRATVSAREPYLLPAALVQRGELVTKVSAAGRAQSVARYDLLTKATLLEIRLPPDSTLWSIYQDDQPTKPQREKDSLLVSLPPQERLAVRKLQIVYESPSAPLGLSGTVEAVAPLLLVRAAGNDQAREVPQTDLQWQLILPSRYRVGRFGGSVETDELPPHELAARKVGRFLYELGGGIRPWYLVKARASWTKAIALADTEPVTESLDAAGVPPPIAAPATDLPLSGEKLVERPRDAFGRSQPEEKALGLKMQLEERAKEIDEKRVARGELALQRADPNSTSERVPARTERAYLGEAAQQRDKSLWALEGVRSLRIDIEHDQAPSTTFRSLGDQPRLEVMALDQRRLNAAACGLALLVALVGIGLTLRPARQKAVYVIVVLLGATVPLLLTTSFDEVGQVFDYVFFAGCWLIVWYVAAAVVLAIYRWLVVRMPADCCQPQTAVSALVLLMSLVLAGPSVLADESRKDDDLIPVAVPADAIIIPYDPEKPGERETGKILVPYAKYVELWNQAHPDKPLEATAPPVGYAIAGTSYEAMLSASDFLSVTGRLEIDVFSDQPVSVPLRLAGGVLERVTVDGAAARLQVVEPMPAGVLGETQANSPAARVQMPKPPPAERLVLMHLSGKGRKKVELQVRLGLVRQGGWRIVHGQLPVGPAAALSIIAPEAGTEIRQSSLADRPSFETKATRERIETSLGDGGRLELQWRPKVAEGMVDQGLTANSTAVFDVREDALRLVWQARLEFGRGQRDSFTFTAPADYLAESVAGQNVRGWTTAKQQETQRIDVTLLKPVQGNETLTLELSQRGRVGKGELETFAAPVIEVEAAALQQGEIVVRKSPRLELRTISATGLSRAESNPQTAAIEKLADASDAALLLTRPYQTFRFVRPPFHLSLAASQAPQETSAEIRAALRIAERDTTLDAAITFRPKGQPLYRVQLYLPSGLTIDRLGPGDLEWSITTENDRQLLTVQLLDGRTDEFTLTLLGKLATVDAAVTDPPQARQMALPKLEVLEVAKQEGEIIILPDPDTDVRLDSLQNCEATPAITPPAWMKPEQRPLARSIVHYRAADYTATLTLTPRTPLVSARTTTNVKITPRSIEETLLINFRIDQAGIRRVVFLVPQHLAKARLKARLLKQKTVEPATTADGQPIAGLVRMTLDLQDYVRGEYAVLLEHDRLLADEKQAVALPVIETGRTDRRLVAIENAGRDEVVIAPADVIGLDTLSRQQQAWRDLAAVLGNQITQAYAALESASQPSLAFTTLQRQRAERAEARIGLATTLLVVDAAGTYRALVQFRVANETEPFLQLTLPAGARLWTAAVAGEPVKPAEATPQRPGVVRIPLVKTAEGEGDYVVELKYGGRLPMSAGLNSVQFPLIRETSIHVEQSIVRLMLPQSQQWFDFRGTMRQVEDEGELVERYQSYLYKRIQDATQALASSSDYTKVRAAVNLKQSRWMLDNSRSMAANNLQNGVAVQKLEQANEDLLKRAEEQAQQQLAAPQAAETDNRTRLNDFYQGQGVTRSKNVVSELGTNFDAAAPANGRLKEGDTLNPLWLEQNKLRTEIEMAEGKGKDALPSLGDRKQPGSSDAAGKAGRYLRGAKPMAGDDAPPAGTQNQAGARAPEIAGKQQLDQLQKKLQDEAGAQQLARRAGGERREELQRYQRDLEQSLNAPAQQPANNEYGLQMRSGESRLGAIEARGGQMPGGGAGGLGGGGYAVPGGARDGALPALQPGSNAPAGQPAGPRSYSGTAPAAAGLTVADIDGEQLSQIAAGLVSLDVQLPQRGRLYRFTTPRGEVEVTARAVPLTVISRLTALAAVLVAVLLGWLFGRPSSRRMWTGLADSRIFAAGLILIGLVSVIGGVLPVAGLVLVVIGITLAIRSRIANRAATVAAETAAS